MKLQVGMGVIVFRIKRANPGLFLFSFGLFKKILQILQQIYVENYYPVNGAGIRTHDLRNMSFFS